MGASMAHWVRGVGGGMMLAVILAELLLFAAVQPGSRIPTVTERLVLVVLPTVVGTALVGLSRRKALTGIMLTVAACSLLLVLAVPALVGQAPSWTPRLLIRYFYALSANPTPYLLAGVLLGTAWFERRRGQASSKDVSPRVGADLPG